MTPGETFVQDGWAFRAWGRPGASAVLLLHGFTLRAEFWRPLAEALAETHFVLAPDLPGHGASLAPAPPEAWRLGETARALAGCLEARHPEARWDVIGYSLGGRLALHLAAVASEQVRSLLLVGASAGLAEPAARAERLASDARWATLLREQGLAAFWRAWSEQPLFSRQAELEAASASHLAASRQGQDAERLALALEAFGLGAQPDLSPLLARLSVPTVWVAGAEDAKFCALARSNAAVMPHARLVTVPACGHNVPLERPEAFRALVVDHLTLTEGATA